MASSKMSCGFCSKTYQTFSQYIKHANQKHLDAISTQWKCCVTCNNFLPTLEELKEHESAEHSQQRKNHKKVLGRTICQFCDTSFSEPKKFYKHCNKVHFEKITLEWEPCKVCQVFFPNENILRAHEINAHRRKDASTPQKMIQCDYCPKSFLNKRRFFNHANADHLDQISKVWVICDVCRVYRPTVEVMNRHKNVHSSEKTWAESYRCEFCPGVFSRTYIYYRHANKEHLEAISGIWFSCQTCGLFFPSPQILVTHKHTAHYTPKEISLKTLCSFCPSTFTCTTPYYRHCNREHVAEISLSWIICGSCEMFFPNETVLHNHSFSVHTDKTQLSYDRVQCHFCPTTFCRAQRYLKHANSVHLDEISKSWFQCKICSSYHPTPEALKGHTSAAHRRKNGDEVRPIQCQFCDFTFNDNNRYYKHANKFHVGQVHEQWVSCIACGYFLPDSTSLKLHVSNRHTVKTEESNKIKCQFCEHTFTKKWEYYKHANKLHSDGISETWESCDECKIFFPTPDTLRVHTAKAHREIKESPAKRITCHLCPKGFTRTSEYYIHAEKTHFDLISPIWHKCPECTRYFPTPVALKNHQVSKYHAGTEKGQPKPKKKRVRASRRNVKPPASPTIQIAVTCVFCSQDFKTNAVFVAHVNQDHQDKVSDVWLSCDSCSFYYPDHKTLKDHQSDCHSGPETEIDPLFIKKEEMDDYIKDVDENVIDDIKYDAPDYTHKDAHDDFDRDMDGDADLADENLKIYIDEALQYEEEDEEAGSDFDLPLSVEINEGFTNDFLDSTSKYQPRPLRISGSRTTSTSSRSASILFQSVKGTYCEDSEDSLDRVETYEETFASPRKRLTVKTSTRLKSGIRKKATGPQRRIECEECGKRFTTAGQLKSHEKNFHDSSQNDESGFIDNEKRAQCQFCELNYSKKSEYYRHANREHMDHLPDCWYLCEICKTFLPTPEILKFHESRTHYNKAEEETSKRFDCHLCDMTFIRLPKYYQHAQKCHFESISQTWLPCPDCGKYYPSEKAIKNHNAIVHSKRRGPVQCVECGKLFSKTSHMTKHEQTVHNKEKNCICEDCGKTFSVPDKLKKHIIFVHRKTDDNSCYICKRIYLGRKSLLRHFREHHPEQLSSDPISEKMADLECHECGKMFRWNRDLQRHINGVHLDLRSFECDVCPKRFVDQRSLNKHASAVHLKRYRCPICARGFTKEHRYNDHMKRTHNKYSEEETETDSTLKTEISLQNISA